MHRIPVIVAALLATGIITNFSYGQSVDDFYKTSTDAQKLQWMDKGIKAVRARLKDPGSAEFRKVYFHRGTDGIPMTCGQVNSKNGFGGMTGFQHFISAGRAELTFLEEEADEFSALWNRFCT